MTVPSQIKPVGVTDKYQHTLIVAFPGFGKTVFGGTAEDALFLTTDPEGTLSAWSMGSTAKEWEIHNWDELNKAYAYLRDGGIKEMGLKWVVVDNATEAQSQGMRSNIERSRKNNAKIDEFVPSLDNHQRTQIMFLDMVRKFHELPVNILWTTWAETHENSEGEEYFAPAIHGQKGAIAQQFAGLMNVVGYGEVVEKDDKEVRRVYFSHAGAFRGKDRYNALGRFRDDLTVPKMEALIGAAVKKRLAERASSKTATSTTKATATRRPVRRTRKA